MKRKYILPDEEKTNHGKPFFILSKLTNITYFPMIDSNISNELIKCKVVLVEILNNTTCFMYQST